MPTILLLQKSESAQVGGEVTVRSKIQTALPRDNLVRDKQINQVITIKVFGMMDKRIKGSLDWFLANGSAMHQGD